LLSAHKIEKKMKKIHIYAVGLLLIIILSACTQQATSTIPPTHTESPTPSDASGYPFPPEIIFQPTEIPGYPEPPDQPDPISTDPAYPAPETSPTPFISSVVGKLLWVSTAPDLFNRIVSIDPSDMDRIAYCAKDEIRVSLDGGQTWEGIPTTGVAAVVEQIGYHIYDSSQAFPQACLSVTLDPEYPNSYYAVFTTADEEFGAPPVFYMGFFTTDNGDIWQLITPSIEFAHTAFGGFWSNPAGPVEALFSMPADSADPGHPVFVQQTGDGGQTWEQGRLACPTIGPCLRWGAAVSNIPGMGSPLPQKILVSFDQSETWKEIEPPVEQRTAPPNQLVAFSDQLAEIISGSIVLSASDEEVYPIRSSQDAGQTWQAKPIPSLPEGTDSKYFPGLQILPDGSYISQTGEQNAWFWLPTSSQTWCPLGTNNLPTYPVLLQPVTDRLWWVNDGTGQAEHLQFSDIACSEE
jgi:hypothetical protein